MRPDWYRRLPCGIGAHNPTAFGSQGPKLAVLTNLVDRVRVASIDIEREHATHLLLIQLPAHGNPPTVMPSHPLLRLQWVAKSERACRRARPIASALGQLAH